MFRVEVEVAYWCVFTMALRLIWPLSIAFFSTGVTLARMCEY